MDIGSLQIRKLYATRACQQQRGWYAFMSITSQTPGEHNLHQVREMQDALGAFWLPYVLVLYFAPGTLRPFLPHLPAVMRYNEHLQLRGVQRGQPPAEHVYVVSEDMPGFLRTMVQSVIDQYVTTEVPITIAAALPPLPKYMRKKSRVKEKQEPADDQHEPTRPAPHH